MLDGAAHLRVRPRVWIGLAIWLGYLILVVLVQLASGIPYTAWGDSAGNLFFGAGLSLIVASVALAITTSLLGWWRPALFEAERSRHRWPILVPILMALLAVVSLLLTDWSAVDLPFFAAAVVLLLVGFTEELTARGLLLVGLRSRLGEGWVWFLTSLLFGLMHGVNILLGQDVFATVIQIVFAFTAGTVFYIVRRVTGTLIWAMVLHAVWDFSQFLVGYGDPSPYAPIVNVFVPVIGVLALVAVPFVLRGADIKPSHPVPARA
ncbi:CPBP family intramembrane glutamic endopeptidase [Leifsonia sp. NPDC077715]|uniref:CPBP family intramembrane glutamic endopeptidase n=1 Tax=Leifsonia sp. NPDC077715 TaxID=3155539 RepID=UPI003415CC81